MGYAFGILVPGEIMEYDEQRAIEDIVARYYMELMTPEERKFHWTFHRRRLSQLYGHTPEMERHRRELMGEPEEPDDPQTEAILERGYDEFIRNAVARVMREDGDKVFPNRCPQCNRIARTPKAKQCRWCQHDWHSTP